MLPEKLQTIINEFTELEDTEEKFELLMEYGQELQGVNEEDKITTNLVSGCLSVVYITVELKEDNIYIKGEADSLLVKGLVQALITGLNGMTVDGLLSLDEEFLTAFGLNASATASRSNASKNILHKIKEQARKLL